MSCFLATLLTARGDLDDNIIRMLELWLGNLLDRDLEGSVVVESLH